MSRKYISRVHAELIFMVFVVLVGREMLFLYIIFANGLVYESRESSKTELFLQSLDRCFEKIRRG